MPNNQASIVVPSCLKTWLAAYCHRTGVKSSELMRLLIVRESRIQRLKAMVEEPVAATPAPDADDKPATVTAYFSTEEEARNFDAHARALGLTRRKAGLMLLQAEQRECWLDRILSQE